MPDHARPDGGRARPQDGPAQGLPTRVLYVQYTSPAAYPPLERSARWFADRGVAVAFLGVALKGAAGDLVLAPHPLITERLVATRTGALGKLNYLRWLLAAVLAVLRQRDSLVYASDLQSYPVAAAASLAGRSVVLHEHDPYTAPPSLKARILSLVRRFAARRAKVCVVPQDARARAFALETGIAPVVAYNCPSREEITAAAGQVAPRPPPFVLWYHGSLSPDQFPPTVVEALALMATPVELRFAGYTTLSAPDYAQDLLTAAARAGVSDRVVYLGAVPTREALFRAARACHVGLALFRSDLSKTMVGASNKPFDYLSCGLPMLVNATEEWRGFFVDAGVARACVPEDPASIAAAVDALARDPGVRAAMAETGRQRLAQVWNADTQFATVVDALSAAERGTADKRAGALP